MNNNKKAKEKQQLKDFRLFVMDFNDGRICDRMEKLVIYKKIGIRIHKSMKPGIIISLQKPCKKIYARKK
jgi:hypothetical protein